MIGKVPEDRRGEFSVVSVGRPFHDVAAATENARSAAAVCVCVCGIKRVGTTAERRDLHGSGIYVKKLIEVRWIRDRWNVLVMSNSLYRILSRIPCGGNARCWKN